jgi:hypothetical protein
MSILLYLKIVPIFINKWHNSWLTDITSTVMVTLKQLYVWFEHVLICIGCAPFKLGIWLSLTVKFKLILTVTCPLKAVCNSFSKYTKNTRIAMWSKFHYVPPRKIFKQLNNIQWLNESKFVIERSLKKLNKQKGKDLITFPSSVFCQRNIQLLMYNLNLLAWLHVVSVVWHALVLLTQFSYVHLLLQLKVRNNLFFIVFIFSKTFSIERALKPLQYIRERHNSMKPLYLSFSNDYSPGRYFDGLQ